MKIRTIAFTTLAVTAILGPMATVATAQPAPRLRWSPCHAEADPRLQCATLSVPLDHDRRFGPTIEIAVIRLPASDPARKIGSLFLNPGGPGTSGVDMVIGAATKGAGSFTSEVTARFDLVGFDPRGIHASTPLLCFESFRDALSVVPAVPFPDTAEDEAAFERADRALNRACQRRAGPIVDHMATANVARDLDLLRAAVGDQQLTYAGYSYGSLLGITYANLFPERVRALVLDGVVDPIAWTTGRRHGARTQPVYNRLGNPAGAQATLEEFFRLCDQAGTRCAFAGNASQRFAALARQLRDTPSTVPDPDTAQPTQFTYTHLIKTTWDAMNVMTTWPEFAQFLSDLEAATTGARSIPDDPAASGIAVDRPATGRYPNIVEGNPGVVCSDSDNPTHHRHWSQTGGEADRRFGYFGRMWTWFSSACATWQGHDADRYTGPFDRHTANPVLLVGTRFDPASPYQNATRVNHLLPNSVLLTVEGWGHTSAEIPSECTMRAVSQYLLHGTTPRSGAVCRPDVGPFDPHTIPGAPSGAEPHNAVRNDAVDGLPSARLLPSSVIRNPAPRGRRW
jgi:pimeloyl-ACP methyl ester carboxylesterase